jgi:hypothetical protein
MPMLKNTFDIYNNKYQNLSFNRCLDLNKPYIGILDITQNYNKIDHDIIETKYQKHKNKNNENSKTFFYIIFIIIIIIIIIFYITKNYYKRIKNM